MIEAEGNAEDVSWRVVPLLMKGTEYAVLVEDGEAFLCVEVICATVSEQCIWLEGSVLCGEDVCFNFMCDEGIHMHPLKKRAFSDIDLVSADCAVGDEPRSYHHFPIVETVAFQCFCENIPRFFRCEEIFFLWWQITGNAVVEFRLCCSEQCGRGCAEEFHGIFREACGVTARPQEGDAREQFLALLLQQNSQR